MSGEIHFSQASGIATLSLSNPDKLNAVDADMWRALQARMSALNADPEVRCVILRGAGDKAFAAGGDIEEFLVVRATVDDALHYHEGSSPPPSTPSAPARCPPWR
jgi:enoyl-CoA hydratase/carnithine racemase